MDNVLELVVAGLVFPLVSGWLLTRFQSSGSRTESEHQKTIEALKLKQAELERALRDTKADRFKPDNNSSAIQQQIDQQERAIQQLEIATQAPAARWRKIVKNIMLLGYLGWLGLFLFSLVGNMLNSEITTTYEQEEFYFVLAFTIYGSLYGLLSLWYLWGQPKPPNVLVAGAAYLIGLAMFIGYSLYIGGEFEYILEGALIIGGFALIHFFVPPLVGVIYNFRR